MLARAAKYARARAPLQCAHSMLEIRLHSEGARGPQGRCARYVFSAALKRLAFETAVLSCSAVCAHFLSPLLNSFAFGFQGCTDDIQRLITEVAGLPCGEVKAEYVSQDAATDDERYAGDSMCACVRHRLLALYSLSVSYGLHHHPFVLISQPLLSACRPPFDAWKVTTDGPAWNLASILPV